MGGWCQVPGAFPEMVLPLFFSNARFRFEPIQYIQHWFDPNPWKITLKKTKKLPWLLLRFSGEGALKGIFFWKVVEHIPIPSGPNGIIFHQAARFPWIFFGFSVTIRYQPWWLEFGHVFRRWFHPRSPEAKSWESRSSNMIKAGATRVTLKFRAPAVFGGLGIGHQITTCWVNVEWRFKKKNSV